jgi:hypothetical protein
MTTSVTGVGSLNYTGVGAPNPPNLVILKRAPNSNDSQNFTLGDLWLYTVDDIQELWVLVSLAGNTATWVQLFPGAGGGATQFPTDSGIANESGGVLNVVGGIGITTSGSGNTVTISSSGTVADTFPTDSGTAVPVGGALNILGGSNIHTSAIGNTVSVALNTNVDIGGSLTLSTFPGVLQSSNVGVVSASRGANGQLLIGHTGVNPAWANITSSGGSVVITNGTGTINLEVTGADASTFVTQSGTATPASGVLHINGTNLLTTSAPGSSNIVDVTLTNGTNGQVPIGGGASPVWANITSDDGSIAITNGVNSIDLSATGAERSTAFFATQTGKAVNVTGRSSPETIYLMGSAAIMNATFNPGGHFFIGDGVGTECSYTAPSTGLYQFNFNVVVINSVGSGGPPALLQFIVGGTSYTNFIFTRPSTSWSNQGSSGISYSQCIPLTASDVVTFSVVQQVTANNTTTIYSTDPINSWNTGSFVTSISGYRVA